MGDEMSREETDQIRAMAERRRDGRAADTDRSRGLYEKYRVARTDGSSEPGRKHDDCPYFVLDLKHDQFAIPAVRAYATLAQQQYPELAVDLFAWCALLEDAHGG